MWLVCDGRGAPSAIVHTASTQQLDRRRQLAINHLFSFLHADFPLWTSPITCREYSCGRRVALSKFLLEQFLKPNMEVLGTEAGGN